MPDKILGPAQHEQSDIREYFIWVGVGLLIASVLAFGLLVLWLYPQATTDRTMRLPLPRYPSPQLQANPREDMARFHDEEMKWLNGSGWIDKAHGVVHIPIADAMRLIAQEGAPGWPKEERP